MKGQFTSLTKSGALPANIGGAEAGALIQAAGKVGAALTAAWSKGGAPAQAVQDISNLAKSGQLAVNFTDLKVPDNLTGERSAPKASNTVNRQVLNQAFTQFIGNAKVPPVDYGSDQPASNPSDTVAAVSSTPTSISSSSSSRSSLEAQIAQKEKEQQTRRQFLERQDNYKDYTFWLKKVEEADQEIARLRAELARLG